MICIPAWLSWDNLQAVLNSAFTTSLVGALAGAYAGARAAQIITERSKERESLLAQIQATNAALMVVFSVFNVGVALKKQHVQPMFEQFQKAKGDLQNFHQQRASGLWQGNSEFRFLADMRTYQAPVAPLDTLKDLVFQKISVYGRPLALVSVIEQSFSGIKVAIAQRDRLIHRFATGEVPKDLIPNYYFGFPLTSGDTNQEFPDLIIAIHSYVNDIIFFSALLSDDLVAHGSRIHAAFTKKFGNGAPKVSTADLSGPRQNGIIPPDTEYADWLRAFAGSVPVSAAPAK